jgi:hypothetical protein
MHSDDYTKIIIGEALDDQNSPLIAHGTPIQTETDPASAVEVSNGNYSYQHERSNENNFGELNNHVDYKEPGEECAMIGCLLSWIPLIGFLTCCLNADAPSKSRREYWAHRACAVATIISLIILVLWLSLDTSSDSDDCIGKACQE